MIVWLLLFILMALIASVFGFLYWRIRRRRGGPLSLSDKTKWKEADVFSLRRRQVAFWIATLVVLSCLAFYLEIEQAIGRTDEIATARSEFLQLRRGKKLYDRKPSQKPIEEQKKLPKTNANKLKLEEKPVTVESPSEAQSDTPTTDMDRGQGGNSDEEIWKFVHQFPLFPGCENLELDYPSRKKCADQKLKNFIQTNLRYPAQAVARATQGTVMVAFVVEKDGKVSDVKVIRDIGDGCGAEAKRVVELMNHMGLKWLPGMQSGRPVRVQFTLPVEFKVR